MWWKLVLWSTRIATAALTAIGAFLLFLGGASLVMSAVLFPWPWRGPAGVGALAGFVGSGVMLLPGLLFTGLGIAILFVVWLMTGTPRLRLPRQLFRR